MSTDTTRGCVYTGINDVFEGENIVSRLKDMIYMRFALIFLDDTMLRFCWFYCPDFFGLKDVVLFSSGKTTAKSEVAQVY